MRECSLEECPEQEEGVKAVLRGHPRICSSYPSSDKRATAADWKSDESQPSSAQRSHYKSPIASWVDSEEASCPYGDCTERGIAAHYLYNPEEEF